VKLQADNSLITPKTRIKKTSPELTLPSSAAKSPQPARSLIAAAEKSGAQKKDYLNEGMQRSMILHA